jgi:DNA-directed RNA polymerase specialized sigma24 family protein
MVFADSGHGLTQVHLMALLTRLDIDPERAGRAFEALRGTLIAFFDWRGAHAPDECADETLNRLARKLAEGEVVTDMRHYALGIGRFVWLEQARQPARRWRTLEEARVAERPAPASDAPPPLEGCLHRCLDELPDDGRTFILGYYAYERGEKVRERARLAEELGLTANAARSRAQRLRDRLERCVRRCDGGADRSG